MLWNIIWKKHKEKIIFVLFLLQITLVYKLIQLIFQSGNIFKIPFIDDKIPFLPIFVVPYFLYVPILLLPFLLAFKNRKYFFALSTTFLFASVVCNIIFILFRTMVIRPEVLPLTIFDRLVLFIYSIDTILNAFPSEHVTFSVLSNLCLLKIKQKIAYAIIPITVLIILSTLFIKQHYTPDIFAGIALAFLSFRLIFKRILQYKNI